MKTSPARPLGLVAFPGYVVLSLPLPCPFLSSSRHGFGLYQFRPSAVCFSSCFVLFAVVSVLVIILASVYSVLLLSVSRRVLSFFLSFLYYFSHNFGFCSFRHSSVPFSSSFVLFFCLFCPLPDLIFVSKFRLSVFHHILSFFCPFCPLPVVILASIRPLRLSYPFLVQFCSFLFLILAVVCPFRPTSVPALSLPVPSLGRTAPLGLLSPDTPSSLVWVAASCVAADEARGHTAS